MLISVPAWLYLQSILDCAGPQSLKPFPAQLGATIYRAAGPDPAKITHRLIDAAGGIQSLIDRDAIVVLKPNSQWWNQGTTNTDVMAEFIQLVLGIPGFSGEIIIADNHQDLPLDSRGWSTKFRNGRFNLNELVEYFQSSGYRNVTKYHWHPAGPNPSPLQMAGFGDNVITHPSEGDGYIWPADLYYVCPYGHKCILAYPVFMSSYSGVTVDLKDGAFRDGDYTGQPVRFINFSALNHHSPYAGVTASIKNYMGVVDMSCGYPAPLPKGTYNTHHIGATAIFKLLWWKHLYASKVSWLWELNDNPSVFQFKYTGGVLGSYMREIRKSDFNIITAIRVGWGSRTDLSKSSQTNTVLASVDPVALDYWASANILLEATRNANAPEEYVRMNDPDIMSGPLRGFLEECRRELGGTIDRDLIKVIDA